MPGRFRKGRPGPTTGEGPTATINITFIIGDHRLGSLEEIKNPVDRIMCRAVSNGVQRKLGHSLCHEHQAAPRVIASGPSADRLRLSVEGCCQALVHAATAALS